MQINNIVMCASQLIPVISHNLDCQYLNPKGKCNHAQFKFTVSAGAQNFYAMHEDSDLVEIKPRLRFRNTLTGSEVTLVVSPCQTLAEIIHEKLLMYNLNALAYTYEFCGQKLDINAKLSDSELGIDDQLELQSLGVDTTPYIPTIYLVFREDI